MDNFEFNFSTQDQLESSSLDKFFLTVFKIFQILPCHGNPHKNKKYIHAHNNSTQGLSNKYKNYLLKIQS